jgi:hypothetical protein
MNGRQFIRMVSRLGRSRGVAVVEDQKNGKGSHCRLYYGSRFTTVKHGEIGIGLLHKMLADLGLDRTDLQDRP